MLFCPFCGTLLLVEKTVQSAMRYFCSTCPYVAQVKTLLTQTHSFTHCNRTAVQMDASFRDGLGGVAEGMQSAEMRCRSDDCDGTKAFFVQLQMRSADEPPTTFYKCAKCSLQWRDD